MKYAIRSTFALTAMTFALTAAAHAANLIRPVPERVTPASVPEIDSSLAAGGLVLLTGGIAVIRSRRTAKSR